MLKNQKLKNIKIIVEHIVQSKFWKCGYFKMFENPHFGNANFEKYENVEQVHKQLGNVNFVYPAS